MGFFLVLFFFWGGGGFGGFFFVSVFTYWGISSESGSVEPTVSTASVVSRPKAQWTAGQSLTNGRRKVSELYQLKLQY